MTILFYDSSVPANIPMTAEYACLYSDGRYAATKEQAARFKHTRWITVEGNWKTSGIADFEQDNPVYDNPDALRTWVAGRIGMNVRARVYTNRANLPLVRERLDGLEYLVWVATLDSNQLKPDWTKNLWGVQFAGNNYYDTSILYGEW